jgi:hypothetical protein
MIEWFASRVFLLWALYRLSCVLRRFYKIISKKLAARRAEQKYIRELAWQIQLDREGDAPWLRSR